MKDKTGWVGPAGVIALAATFLCFFAFTGCAGFSTHQKIAVACESAASSLDAVTSAKLAGKASAAQLNQAIAIYSRTTPFCQPVASSLPAAKQAALSVAVAELTALAGGVR